MEYPRPVVAYLRVSTSKQELESQWVTIETWARMRGVKIDEMLVEVESGAEDQRPRFQELWSRVRRGAVGTIVVAELSRLSRRMRTLVDFLYDCFENGVMVVSVREGWLEQALTNDIMRPLVVAVFATLYELERKMISERTKAGMARAKAEGRHVGRPRKLGRREVEILLRLRREGVPVSRIAERLGVSRSTVYRYLKRLEAEGAAP